MSCQIANCLEVTTPVTVTVVMGLKEHRIAACQRHGDLIARSAGRLSFTATPAGTRWQWDVTGTEAVRQYE